MPEFVKSSRHGDVLVLEIDNPPVNALSPGVPEALHAALDAAEARSRRSSAIVVRGAGRTFVAGADINTLEEAAWGNEAAAPDWHALLSRIEDSHKPVVMAIHGTALGGGLELAMTGHYRIAAASAQVGQPEVNLGIIPGAEGTQRLPRLAGIAKALDMCVTGSPIPAAEALSRRHHRRDRGRRSHGVGRGLRAQRRGGDGRAHRKTSDRHDRLGDDRRPMRRCWPTRAQLAAKVKRASDGAAQGRRRHRGRRAPAVRGRVPARARSVPRVRALGAGQGARPRVLRRARGGEAARGRQPRRSRSSRRRRHRRRRDDGRRDRDGLRERRPRRGADRRRRPGPRRRHRQRSGRTTTCRCRAGA